MSERVDAEIQRLFDIVWERAKTPIKAKNGPLCAYRSADGMKCFWGECIPDDRYQPIFEHHSPAVINAHERDSNPSHALLLAGLQGEFSDKELPALADFANEIQGIHDDCDPIFWERLLTDLAQECGLMLPGEEESL